LEDLLQVCTKTSFASREFSVKHFSGIGAVGVFSEQMTNAVDLAEFYHEEPDIPLLIEGETGTGKEVIARLVHFGRKISQQPFISINCSSLTPSLIESELFGYDRGAFTGARNSGSIGKIESAQDGTLFLDEIGELPIDLQPKLLRVLQEKEFFRVGGTKNIRLNFRVIAATNRDLKQRIEFGDFRRDLFFRLDVGKIFLPPLRQQREAIIPLAFMFLEQASQLKEKRFHSIHNDLQAMMIDYSWPGNIRELKNYIERAVFLYDDWVLRPDHMDFVRNLEGGAYRTRVPETKAVSKTKLPQNGFNLKQFEIILVKKALEKFNNNKTKTAEYLGISRHSVNTRIKKFS